MTAITTPEWDATAAGPTHGLLNLVEMQFVSGTLRLTTFPVDVPAMGQTWKGLGFLGEVGQLHESEDGAAEKLDLTLSHVAEANLALALGNTSNYQDRPVRVWVALLDASTLQIVGAPILRFAGVMDRPRIERGDGSADATGKVVMECLTASYNPRLNPAALRMNNAQHQARHPGERGFEQVASLIGTPFVWLTKAQQQYLAG
ncbi:hypothetical protein GT347_20345 [Xylophilus rhododendri]|uniref:Uncharacterized protein n=1 Tax=Xylophilus rhododendri TaxID=2697032 RepID=A0A857JAW5_9BURK|nr:hypothetical protein [Xylophilus rhododendri]QHJ00123.1 hypothetical protein GT347_20345 [Xylophilus rhododendri]